MDKKGKLRKKTQEEAEQCLERYHKCLIVRPPGYGKTGILTNFIKKYEKVLYLYPTDIIWETVLDFYYGKQRKENEIPNTTHMTYQKLSVSTKEELMNMEGYDLVIMDECHRIGGKRTREKLHILLDEILTKADRLGATATPERTDLVDEATEFFDNRSISAYTVHDAFMDNILKKPYYCYCAADYKDEFEKIRHLANEEIEKMDSMGERREAGRNLDERMLEISSLVRMPNIIHETCEECVKDTSYMKFIVFCATIEHIAKCRSQVKGWFGKAYPSHSIKTIAVSSENKKTKENVKKLGSLVKRKNGIDLIFCCDMLNMGYHVDNITGIVMYRFTDSNIVYMQQLGRILNSGSDENGLVFDIVDNIHRKSMYKMAQEKEYREKRRRIRNYEKIIAATRTEQREYGALSKEEIREYLELKGEADDMKSGRYDTVTKNDLIITGFQATYEELIRKTIAEPVSMRCRQVYEMWVRQGGRTTGCYAGIAGVLLQERKAREANYGYGCKNECVPITPFAKLKKVSVKKVLEVIFGEDETEEYADAIREIMSNRIPS